MNFLFLFIGCSLAFATTTVAQTSAAPRYRFELLQPVGLSNNYPLSINKSNVIVGLASNQFAGTAALWAGNRSFDLGNGEGSPFAQASANKISDRNQIVGSTSFSSDQPQHAAFFINQKWVDAGTGFPDPSSFSTFRSINESGVAAGERAARTPTFQTEAFVWRKGVFTTITLGGQVGQAQDINEAGVVVGISDTKDRVPHAFSWKSGTITDLGVAPGILRGSQSQALAVNNADQVVGVAIFNAASGFRATLWANGSARDLGLLPGDSSSTAYGINDAGVIVGVSETEFSEKTAFVMVGGTMYDLNALLVNPPAAGTTLASATAIGPDGTIVGTTFSGFAVAGGVFKLTPVR